ncbi:MAG: GNAT family N-acetyltransferase [Desulfurococcales archaeon]|nr:GNAT family N-acetyltransferase [Desulfurococcales archaeon]
MDSNVEEKRIVIKKADKEDLEGFLDLYAEFYNDLRLRQGLKQHSREKYHGDVERYLSRDKVFLAETDRGEAIGFIRVSEREGCYWIEELYVQPVYRGKGVGRRLVEKAEDYIKEHDSHVYIMVLPQDRRAMSFWLHHGYTLLNTVELAKSFGENKGGTRLIPLLGSILEMYRWSKEDYAPLENKFLELVEEFQRKGGGARELLEIFVKALEEYLSKTSTKKRSQDNYIA